MANYQHAAVVSFAMSICGSPQRDEVCSSGSHHLVGLPDRSTESWRSLPIGDNNTEEWWALGGWFVA